MYKLCSHLLRWEITSVVYCSSGWIALWRRDRKWSDIKRDSFVILRVRNPKINKILTKRLWHWPLKWTIKTARLTTRWTDARVIPRKLSCTYQKRSPITSFSLTCYINFPVWKTASAILTNPFLVSFYGLYPKNVLRCKPKWRTSAFTNLIPLNQS